MTEKILKISYAAIGVGCLGYFFSNLHGQSLQAAAKASAGMMYAVIGLIIVFGVASVFLSFEKPQR